LVEKNIIKKEKSKNKEITEIKIVEIREEVKKFVQNS